MLYKAVTHCVEPRLSSRQISLQIGLTLLHKQTVNVDNYAFMYLMQTRRKKVCTYLGYPYSTCNARDKYSLTISKCTYRQLKPLAQRILLQRSMC